MASDLKSVCRAMVFCPLFVGAPAIALTAMSETELSAVSGQDGLSVVIEDNGGWSAGALNWANDVGAATQQGLSLDQLALETLGTTDFEIGLDIGDTAVSGTTPSVGLTLLWDELKITTGGLYIFSGNLDTAAATRSPQSGGEIGFFSSGGITLVNQGLFNSSATNAYLKIDFSDNLEEDPTGVAGDFILRQGGPGTPEFSFGNANLTLETTNCNVNDCILGFDADGPYLYADTLDLDLNFDILFKNNPTDFDRTGRSELIKFGWTGGLANFNLGLNANGISSTGANQAQGTGITLDVEFDYQSDFTLILGQAGQSNARAEFKNYLPLDTDPAAEPVFRMPVTFDPIDDTRTFQALCLGNDPGCTPAANEESVVLSIDRQALGVLIRDGRLHAYNSFVDVVDPSASGNINEIDGTPGDINENTDGDDYERYNWSLGFTFGQLDSNIALYPGYDSNYDGVADETGLTADVVLTANSPGFWQAVQTSGDIAASASNWRDNTHFFIGDTLTAVDVDNADGDNNPATGAGDAFAFGLMNADLLWVADNMAIRVASDTDTAFAGLAGIPALGLDLPGGLWLESRDGVRYQFRGVLGGGSLSDLSDLVSIALVDINLDTDKFVFALSPANTNPASIGYAGLLDFNAGTYISLAEPNNPDAAAGVSNLTGRVVWENGKVQITSRADDPNPVPADRRPALTLANDILIGSTAYGGQPLRADVTFGADRLGEVAIPSGQFYSSFSLKPL